MKFSIAFFVKYYLFWLAYFVFFKSFFLLFNIAETAHLTGGEIAGVFLHGSVMDFSAAGYASLFAGIALAFSAMIKFGFIEKIIRYYTVVLLIALSAVGLTDSVLYAPWGVRLNAQILPYLENPGGMWASLSWWQWLLAFLIETGIVCTFFFLFKKIFTEKKFDKIDRKWQTAPVLLFLTAVLIIPIRGGFDRAPLNFSNAYFSHKRYANHAAYNFFWSFAYSLTYNNMRSNPVHYFPSGITAEIVENNFSTAEENIPAYLESRNGKPLNVVVVILESFSNKVIESLGGKADLTPNLNRYCREGISFTNFYAAGIRSDRGISALLASYPALLRASAIINFPEKLDKLDYLPQYFNSQGYRSSFYYGGDVDFYNTRMLLMKSGISRIVSKSDFPMSQNRQKWGIPDEYLFERAARDFLNEPEPFLGMLYNISSHEPFDIPDFERAENAGGDAKYFNAVAYTDSCLGVFIDKLRQSSRWDNTLVVITSDHASLQPGPTRLDELSSFRLPLIWIGGAVKSAATIETICQQNDLSGSLVQQMGWQTQPTVFAKNLFGARSYAFFYNINGWGFVSPKTAFYLDEESKKLQFYYGENAPETSQSLQAAKAYTQYLHEDFLKR